jgi:glyoxylase-like metal-dependent hydrolase (beta-lactamase superfamily II)
MGLFSGGLTLRTALAVCLTLIPALAVAQPRTADPTKRGFQDSDFPRVVKIAENVYGYEDFHPSPDKMTTVSMWVVTRDGVVLADGQADPAKTQKLLDAIAKTTDKPLKYYIVCSDHGDHTGGNSVLPAGVTMIAHPTSKAVLEKSASAPTRRPDAPKVVVPNEVLQGDKKVITLGGTEIQVLFLGRAHTGGDLHVYLPRQKILFMSEAYLNRVFPAMRSAYPSEWVGVIDKALKMDVTTYVPGHGFVEQPAASREELQNYRKALTAVIAEAKRLHAAGVPVEDAIKQADFGEYQQWKLHESQRPIAVRKIYEELDGKLPKPTTH